MRFKCCLGVGYLYLTLDLFIADLYFHFHCLAHYNQSYDLIKMDTSHHIWSHLLHINQNMHIIFAWQRGWRKQIIFKWQKFSLQVMRNICFFLCQFQSGVAYKSVTYKNACKYKNLLILTFCYTSWLWNGTMRLKKVVGTLNFSEWWE